MRRSLVVAAAAVLALVAMTSTGSAHTTGSRRQTAPMHTASSEGVPRLSHVFLIVGENTDYSDITPKSVPYLYSLKKRSAWLTDYYSLHHNSAGNYVGITSGQYTICEQQDVNPGVPCMQDVPNIFTEMDAANESWRTWAESMPYPCTTVSTGSDRNLNLYAAYHIPVLYFSNISAAECKSYVIPTGTTDPNDMTYLNDTLAKGHTVATRKIARFNLIIPNKCEDAHDVCHQSPVHGRLKQFDDFLRREIPLIEQSPSFDDHSLIVIVFDEGSGGAVGTPGKRIVMMMIGGQVSPGVYGGQFDHYSLLRTLQDGFGLQPYLGGAASAAPINTVWK